MDVIYFALCSIAVTHIDNSKGNVIIFMRNLLRVFVPPIIIEVLSSPVQKNLRSPKLSCHITGIHSVQ